MDVFCNRCEERLYVIGEIVFPHNCAAIDWEAIYPNVFSPLNEDEPSSEIEESED